jgi:hypothetical protein
MSKNQRVSQACIGGIGSLTWFLQMREKEAHDFIAAGIQPRVTTDDFRVLDASDVEKASAFLQASVSNDACNMSDDVAAAMFVMLQSAAKIVPQKDWG